MLRRRTLVTSRQWAVYLGAAFIAALARSGSRRFLPIRLSAGVSLTGEMAPEGMGATAQALYGAMRGGLASAAGAYLGGLVYDYWGTPALFRCGGLAIAAARLFFALTDWPSLRGHRAAGR